MSGAANRALIHELQEKIDKIAGGSARKRTKLPFGVPEIDDRLPGGLAFGALHEIAGGGSEMVAGAVSALLAASIAARTKGMVVWCLTRPDLFAPGLAQVGLHPDRVIYCESDNEDGVLASMEEALSFGGLSVVVGELVRLPMTESRRLHLAAEKTGVMGVVIRRWRRPAEATDFGNPTASSTRWRVSCLPSEPLPVDGVGRPRWRLELIRAKAGESFDIAVGAPDSNGLLSPVRPEQHLSKTGGPKWSRI